MWTNIIYNASYKKRAKKIDAWYKKQEDKENERKQNTKTTTNRI